MQNPNAASNCRVRNFVISGTNCWNPGDDFVRDGVIHVLHQTFPGEHLNFHFYNFAEDQFPKSKFRGIGNEVSAGDLEQCCDFIDGVIIAGLSAGHEIKDLYNWVLTNGLEDRVFLVGAGYENSYCAEHVLEEPEATIFRKARIIIGRTAKHPAFIKEAGSPYVHLNCPALLSVPEVKPIVAGRRIQRIGFSIQLAHDTGIVNQTCAPEVHRLARQLLLDLAKTHEVELVAHHKSEYFLFLRLLRGTGVPVIYSSFYHDLHEVYQRYDCVVTTRLHSSLYANGHGIPGITINDTDRHTHTLAGFPHSAWVNTREAFDHEFARLQQLDLPRVATEMRVFKEQLTQKYVRALRPAFAAAAQAGSAESADTYQFDSEKKEQLLVRSLLKPGMKVLDVGAHIGKYSKLFSLIVGEQGRVFAFEPTPASARKLAGRIESDHLDNVTLIRKAVCDHNGIVTLHQFPEEYSSWNGLGRPSMEDPRDASKLVIIAGHTEVAATTLDEFCQSQGLTRIDYLKLDVEGAEIHALQGAVGLLSRQAISCLQFEVSRKMLDGLGTRARDVFEFLAGHAYECHVIGEDGQVGPVATDSEAFYDNYIAFPVKVAAPINPARDLPIHFFTIVLNGQPFIRHHIEVLRQLPFRWHWHIVEGVADLTHDTAWSKALGGRITSEIHQHGLSNDGTTEYLDALAKNFPDHVTIYRKPAGAFWDGKLEMVNAPLQNIREDCLLWQVDADELWTAEQLTFARRLFLARPDKTSAFYLCHYFVGENLVITTRDTYGNHTDYEWIRTWRYKPGCRWGAHEPPRLCQPDARGQLADLATINPFCHRETEALDLVFQHHAYTTEAQLRFKEIYYGYAGAVGQWRRLQAQKNFPVQLSDHFAWVKDKAQVNTAVAEGVLRLARTNERGEWEFAGAETSSPFHEPPQNDRQPFVAYATKGCQRWFLAPDSPPILAVEAPQEPRGIRREPDQAKPGEDPMRLTPDATVQKQESPRTLKTRSSRHGRRDASASPTDGVPLIPACVPERVLFVRTDSIGDAVLAASMLSHLRRKYSGAQIGVLCQEQLSELYLACPFVDAVISFDKKRATENQVYRDTIIAEIGRFQPGLILNSTYSSEPLTELLVHSNRSAEVIGLDGDLSNRGAENRHDANSLYSRLISSPGGRKPELERHRDFLSGLGIIAETLAPQIWTTPEDDARADALIREHHLEPARTIAVFPGAQHDCKVYPHYAEALREFSGYRFVILGGPEFAGLGDQLASTLPGVCVNLAGKTSLLEMAGLLRKCRLYVGADSAGAHLACAVDLPNVVVLGGGHFGRFLPYSPLTSVAALPLECYGCNWACRHQRSHCVKDLAPEVLAQAVRETLSRNSPKPRLFVQDGSRWQPTSVQPRSAGIDLFVSRETVEVVPVAVAAAALAPTPFAKPAASGEILVSVLVSTYNSERYLRACLEDLEAQTIAHRLEIIVIDSGSQQNERAIVEEFQQRHRNIVYLRTERETLYAAWNRGVRMARGQFITNANSDDSHRADALEILVAALGKHPEASLAYGNFFTSVVPNDTFTNPHILRRVVLPPYHPATLLFYCVIGCHPMWRRTVFDKIGLFDASFTTPGDYEFLLRFAQAGLRAVRVPQELSLFYQNPDGLSFRAQSKTDQEFSRIHAKYRAEMPIDRLYQVDPADPGALARAWVALGNLAMRYQAPWFDNISQDLDYATTCYTRSLKHDPRNPAALHNLAVAKILRGLPRESEPFLQQLPLEHAGKLRASLRGGCLDLMAVDMPSAVEPLEFPPASPLPFPDAVASNIVAFQPKPGCHVAGRGAGLPVRWVAPFFTTGEYSSDALNLVLPLSRQIDVGVADQSEPYSATFAASLAPAARKSLQAALEKFPFIVGGIAISHRPASQFNRVRGAAYHIGRTMFETDGLPPDWVRVCNLMDEIWVPSQFNVETFARGGVERDKLFVVPGAVDMSALDPTSSDPLPLPHRAACNFLSVFEWSARSGWDVLLAAYGREFSAADDVCLHLRAWLPDKPEAESRELIERMVRDFMGRLDLGGKAPPRLEILPALLPEAELPRLYRAADCFVSPHRADGAGRALLEAMAMGLPVIATRWGASAEIVNADTGYPLESEVVEVRDVEPGLRRHRGHHWANPSERHLRELMRRVQQNREEARRTGRKARAHVQQNFSGEVVTARMVQRLREIERKLSTPACPAVAARPLTVAPEFPGRKARAIKVAWEGSFLDLGSLSHVNRELTKPLAAHPNIQLTCVGRNSLPEEPAAMPALREMARRLHAQPDKQTHVTVRHAWPPDWQAPASDLWVLIQPWEFEVLPTAWVRHLGRVNEIWAPSEYVRRICIESGVEPAKVKVVPNGIDPAVFRPDAVPMKLATRKRFKFLFVGGTIYRKGPDLLLQAYLDRFRAADDVCLVIKDFGGKSAYAGQTFEAQIRTAQAKPDAPEILYLNEDLPPDELPGLYTACDCLVHPYREEGFGLPVLEAMACGLLVIVTGGGATDDFATDEFACRLPALRQSLHAGVDGMELVREGWLLEPSRQAIVEAMAEVFRNPDPARAKGRAASDHVRREWTWERTAQIAAQRLQNLVARQQAAREAIAKRRARTAPAMDLPPVARLGQLHEARTAVREKEFGAAWNLTCSAIEARPHHPEGYRLLAEIAQASGDPARARHCAKRACQLAPKWKPAKEFLKSLPAKTGIGRKSDFPLPKAAGVLLQRPRLSVCLIVRNEEQFLGRCLESVRDLAHQIVVVDTGSTDSTVEIARRHGAEVYSFPWRDDFSAARNASLERATGDWVLVLDADEELSPEGRSILEREMTVGSVMAYRLPILDRGREEDGCSYVPRLFRNAPGLFFVGRVHEQVSSSVEVRRQEWGLENRLGKSVLIHHGYLQEVARQRHKNARNLALLEKAIEEMPNEPNLLMNHGLELIRAGQLEAGLVAYWEAFHLLSALPPGQVMPELREALLMQLASHLLGAKDFNAVTQLLHSSLAKAQGLSASLHFSLGLALMELKQFTDAAEQMGQCLSKRNQPALTPGNKEIRRAAPRHCLAVCLKQLKQTKEAAKAFAEARAEDPNSRPVCFDYVRFLVEQDQPVEALKLLHQMIPGQPEDADVWLLGGQIALGRPEFIEFARDWTGEAIQHLPQHPQVVLQRAEALLLTGDTEASLALWGRAASPTSARHLAARLICEMDCGRAAELAGAKLEAGVESLLSEEFLKWYRRLLDSGAARAVSAVNSRLPQVRRLLPSAGRVLEQALAEADQVAAI